MVEALAFKINRLEQLIHQKDEIIINLLKPKLKHDKLNTLKLIKVFNNPSRFYKLLKEFDHENDELIMKHYLHCLANMNKSIQDLQEFYFILKFGIDKKNAQILDVTIYIIYCFSNLNNDSYMLDKEMINLLLRASVIIDDHDIIGWIMLYQSRNFSNELVLNTMHNAYATAEQVILLKVLKHAFTDEEFTSSDYTFVHCLLVKLLKPTITNKEDELSNVLKEMSKHSITLAIEILGDLSIVSSFKESIDFELMEILIMVLNNPTLNKQKNFKVNTIICLSNLLHDSRANQDYIRNNIKFGIHSILNCTNIDDDNEFIREWCIFAIRNLTENNLENQEAIKELRMQGVADSSILKKSNLKVEIDPETNKPKVMRKV